MNNQVKKFDRRGGVLPSFFNRYWNDDFFDNFFDGDRLPATNVKENEKEFKLELSVPGFDKEDFNIEIDKNVLKISARKEVKNEEKDENDKILRQEFGYSSFSRSFMIPENVDTEHIAAKQKDGILEISLPKMDKALEDKVKKIEIK
ncbi:MAG: Hsp20/alpha crystallin family protein [Dysgonomonas sp.]|nr:Hsp20/alpha crystallin family protein [Dysgonomonas sp.]